MDTLSTWLTIGIPIISTIIAIWQASLARQSAAEAQRSAAAAQGQLELMQEQWEAEKAEKAQSNQPRLHLWTERVSDVETVLLLQNMGEQTLIILGIWFNGRSFPFESINARKINIQTERALAFQQKTPIFRGVRLGVPVASGPYQEPTEPKDFEINFEYGGSRWSATSKLEVADDSWITVPDGPIRKLEG